MPDEKNEKLERLKKRLQKNASGWTPEKDGYYDAETLFDLIDGGAEVYLALNVKCVLNRVYTKEGAADIFVDIFDMGSSEDAFGAYHHDLREEQDVGIGQDSEYQGGSLFFWKNRFFVSIVALEASEEMKAAVIGLGRGIDGAINKKGKPPNVFTLLPERGLQKEHLYFFHDATSLSRRYDLGEGNPLILSPQTDGILSRYRFEKSPESKAVFLVVEYRDPKTAEGAARALKNHLFGRADVDDVRKRGGEAFAGVVHKNKRFAAVLEASSKAEAETLLKKTLSRM